MSKTGLSTHPHPSPVVFFFLLIILHLNKYTYVSKSKILTVEFTYMQSREHNLFQLITICARK